MLWPLTVNFTRQIEGLRDKEEDFCFAWTLGTVRELYSLAQYITYIAICSLSIWSIGILPGLISFTPRSPCWFFSLCRPWNYQRCPKLLSLSFPDRLRSKGFFCSSFESSLKWLSRENIFSVFKIMRNNIQSGFCSTFPNEGGFWGELHCVFSAVI